jgi:hypothetical protein
MNPILGYFTEFPKTKVSGRKPILRHLCYTLKKKQDDIGNQLVELHRTMYKKNHFRESQLWRTLAESDWFDRKSDFETFILHFEQKTKVILVV